MTKKLLLADDSITIQKVIGIIFATEDYELIVCDDGNEAFMKAMQEYPDLVIADVSMPGKDGFELCEAIKGESRLGHTSVLLLPGTFEHFDENRAEEVGADGWISKPFESQALLDKVAQLLDAEPVRLAVESAPAVEVADVAVDEVVTSDVNAVDDVVLGLDEVDALEEVPAGPEEDDSADDIWDAVSFEEDELQPVDDLSPTAETDLVEEFAVTEEPEEAPLGLDSAEDSDFVLTDAAEEPLELTDVVGEDSGTDEPLELEAEDELLALDEEAAVDEVELAPASFEAPIVPEEPVALVETETDFSSAQEPEDLPVVEPLDEASLDEDEEVLDLAEDDILEEVPEEVVELESETVEGPMVDFSDEAGEEAFILEEEAEEVEESAPVVEAVIEETAAFDEVTVEEPTFEPEPEISTEPEATEDEGFYYDASETADEESTFEPVAEVAAVAASETVSSVEHVEQQLRELSEDELKDVVAKVAGPTIEKLANEMLEQIVWEVVPDLAESMIREEIRKIRQGAE